MAYNATTLRGLIDLAIGSPDPGHVNFFALHCVLTTFAEKLQIADEPLNMDKFSSCPVSQRGNSEIYIDMNSPRKIGGTDMPEELVEEEGTASKMQINEPVPVPSEITVPEPIPMELPEQPEVKVSDNLIAAEEQEALEKTSMDITETNSTTIVKTPLGIHLDAKTHPVVHRTLNKVETGLLALADQMQIVSNLVRLLYTLGVERAHSSQNFKDFNIAYQQLRHAQRENIFLGRTSRYSVLHTHYMDIMEENSEFDQYVSSSRHSHISLETASDDLDLDHHLPLPSDRFAEEWYKIKASVCNLSNKVSMLTDLFVQYEKERAEISVRDLKQTVEEMKVEVATLRIMINETDERVKINYDDIRALETSLQELDERKVDKKVFEFLMAQKVNFEQLKRKVSNDTMLEIRCCIEKRLNELANVISAKEFTILNRIDIMEKELGANAIDRIMTSFKTQVNEEIAEIRKLVQDFLDSTNDECAAAGGRFKVIENMACVSCDNPCVMRALECKVGKMPDYLPSQTIAPIVAYELDTIRKKGITTQLREELTGKAFFERNRTDSPYECSRRAGGPHTMTTTKERIEKILKNPKIV